MKQMLFIALILLSGITFSLAQELPPVPERLVSDEAGLLTAQQARQLEQKLVSFDDTTSTQIAIFITGDLQGYDIADFTQRVAQRWGVGQRGKDNGVMIVLKPKTASERGDVNIEVGYGLEPIIPDITAQHIVDNEMIPRFMNDDYFGGLDAATNVIMALSAGHFTADEYESSHDSGGAGWFIPIIVLIIVITMIRRSKSNYYHAGKSSLPFWTALWLGSALGRSSGGSWNNFTSGSGGFGGGGGGGGFGGFGGGGFGGGGASGSW
jgi:uncharacterized protein